METRMLHTSVAAVFAEIEEISNRIAKAEAGLDAAPEAGTITGVRSEIERLRPDLEQLSQLSRQVAQGSEELRSMWSKIAGYKGDPPLSAEALSKLASEP